MIQKLPFYAVVQHSPNDNSVVESAIRHEFVAETAEIEIIVKSYLHVKTEKPRCRANNYSEMAMDLEAKLTIAKSALHKGFVGGTSGALAMTIQVNNNSYYFLRAIPFAFVQGVLPFVPLGFHLDVDAYDDELSIPIWYVNDSSNASPVEGRRLSKIL